MGNDASINRTGPLAVTRSWPGATVPVATISPGTAPTITSLLSGTLAQGSTLSLAVSNITTKRNGQIMFFAGYPSKDGLIASDLLPDMNTTHTAVYRHSVAADFMGTGAGLFLDAPVGSQGAAKPWVVLDQNYDELFYTTTKRLRLIDTGIIAESNQIKLERMNQGDTTPFHESNLHTTLFWTPDADHSPTLVVSKPVVYYVDNSNTPSFNNWHTAGLFDKWHRNYMYLKVGSPDQYDGSVFYAVTNEETGETWIGGDAWYVNTQLNDPSIPYDSAYNDWLPKYKHLTRPSDGPTPPGPDHVFLPGHYAREGAAFQIEVGAFYINDSCERVELGNAPTYDTCTKRVVQEQVQRIPGQVDFKVYLANINPSTEPVYAFVFNQDGHYSPGYKVGGV